MRLHEVEQLTMLDFVKRVKEDCKPFLYNNPNHIALVRGMNYSGPVLDKPVRVRQPKKIFSGYEATKTLHDLMTKDGFKATRLHGLFTMPESQRKYAGLFGNLYAVFPVGDYDLTWFNPDQMMAAKDLGDGGWLSLAKNEYYKQFPDKDDFSNLSDQTKAEFFWTNFKQFYHHGTNVASATEHNSEVLVYCDKVHACPYNTYAKIKRFIYSIKQ